MCLFQSCLRYKKSPCADHKRQHRAIHLYIELARTPAEELENLHPLGLYLLQEIGARNIGEATTTELSKAHQPEGFSESQKIARHGGSYAGQVRQDIEKDTGRPVITSQNAAQLNAVVVDMIESVAETEKPDNDENK